MRVALEVTQEWGEVVLESRQFPDGDVVVGSSSGTRWRFLGVDMGFVPAPIGAALSWLAPFWSDVERTYRADLLVPASELPDERDWTLFTTRDGVRVARIAPGWTAAGELDGERLALPDLLERGLAGRDEDGAVTVPMIPGLALRVEGAGQAFTGRMAPRPAHVPVRPEPDHAFLALALPGSLAFVGLAVIASMITPLRTETTSPSLDDEARVVELTAPPPPARTPPGSAKGGATTAKTSEGPKAPTRGHGPVSVKQAGVLSGLDRILGAQLPDGLVAAIGVLTGPNGHGIGGGGLGVRGDGLGSGGDAEGFEGPVGTGLGDGVSGCCGDGPGKQDGALASLGSGDPIVIGSLDKAAIDEVVKRHMATIRYCYQRELQRKPDLEGKVTVKFTIARDGTVSAADVRSSTLGSAAVEACVAGRFLRMSFPEPKGGGIVVVSYPFLFGRG